MNACLEYCSLFQVDWIVCVVKSTAPFYVGALSFLSCLRPLWVDYPKDTATFTIDDEYLIGEIVFFFFFYCF